MELSDTVVEVKHLTKTYNLYNKPIDRVKEIFSFSKKEYSTKYDALKDVCFQVKRGETLGRCPSARYPGRDRPISCPST